MIRNVQFEDSKEICDIYNYYIENTTITFEENKISLSELENRIQKISSVFPWLVLEEQSKIIGYAYASNWRDRSAYRFSVESTVYLHKGYLGKGFGKLLYIALIDKLKDKNIHCVIGGIALPNNQSEKLHKDLGYQKVAHLKEVGFKFDKWIDVAYWELLL